MINEIRRDTEKYIEPLNIKNATKTNERTQFGEEKAMDKRNHR